MLLVYKVYNSISIKHQHLSLISCGRLITTQRNYSASNISLEPLCTVRGLSYCTLHFTRSVPQISREMEDKPEESLSTLRKDPGVTDPSRYRRHAERGDPHQMNRCPCKEARCVSDIVLRGESRHRQSREGMVIHPDRMPTARVLAGTWKGRYCLHWKVDRKTAIHLHPGSVY